MTSGIYIITERATGKMYVGLSQGIEGRWTKYKKRFPKDSFTYEVLLPCSPDISRKELGRLEKFYIKELDCMEPNGFNRTTGGTGSYSISQKTKDKISKSLKGHSFSPETIEKLSKATSKQTPWNKGKPMSEEQRQKLSIAKKGKKLPSYSEERSKNQSEAQKRRWAAKRLEGQLLPPVDENRKVTSEMSVESGPALLLATDVCVQSINQSTIKEIDYANFK